MSGGILPEVWEPQGFTIDLISLKDKADSSEVSYSNLLWLFLRPRFPSQSWNCLRQNTRNHISS